MPRMVEAHIQIHTNLKIRRRMLIIQAVLIKIKENSYIVGNVKVSIIISLNIPIFSNDKVRAKYYLCLKKILNIVTNLRKLSEPLLATLLRTFNCTTIRKKNVVKVVKRKKTCISPLKSLIICYINNGLRM